MILENEVRKVKEYYSKMNHLYLKYFGRTLQAYRNTNLTKLHDNLFDSIGLREGMRVLDAGCGFCGPAFHFASKANIHIDAITISPEQYGDVVKQLRKKKLVGNINPKIQDYHFIPESFDKDLFDAIYFLESLVHSPNPGMVIQGCQETLKKGGVLYIRDFYYGTATDEIIRENLDVAVKNCNSQTCQSIRPVDEILKVIREHNLKLLSCNLLPYSPELDFSIVDTFYKETGAKIYKDQEGDYTSTDLEYVVWYEIKAMKPYK